MDPIAALAQALATGQTTSRALIEDALTRIGDPNGEGSRTFIKVHADQARAMADAMDGLRRAGRAPVPAMSSTISSRRRSVRWCCISASAIT